SFIMTAASVSDAVSPENNFLPVSISHTTTPNAQNVGPPVHGLGFCLFGRHIRRCSEDHARRSSPPRSAWVSWKEPHGPTSSRRPSQDRSRAPSPCRPV